MSPSLSGLPFLKKTRSYFAKSVDLGLPSCCPQVTVPLGKTEEYSQPQSLNPGSFLPRVQESSQQFSLETQVRISLRYIFSARGTEAVSSVLWRASRRRRQTESS